MDDLDVPVASVPAPRAALATASPLSDHTPILVAPGLVEASPQHRTEVLHAAMDAEEVRGILGEPDSIARSNVPGSETWNYGRSLLFFQDNHLTGWSDTGGLAARAAVRALTPVKREKAPEFTEQGWKNAWQREAKPDLGEIIEEIIDAP